MAKFQNIFVTGGAGYIGSHCVVELLEAGYEVIACDNFTNSVNGEKGTAPSLERVEEITGKKVTFYQCDLLDYERLDKIFSQVFPSVNYWFIYLCSILNVKHFSIKLTVLSILLQWKLLENLWRFLFFTTRTMWLEQSTFLR